MTDYCSMKPSAPHGPDRADTPPCTADEHLEYLSEIVKLKLSFLFMWLCRHPEASFSSAIRSRVDIYTKTHLNEDGLCPAMNFDHPDWLTLEERAQRAFEAHRGDPDPSGFERDAFAVFRESIALRAPLSYSLLVSRNDLEDYQCGSLRYDTPTQSSPDRVFFHIANAIRPDSIFSDPKYIPACLCDLMDRCEREFGAKVLTTFTWLNAVPRWVLCFPPCWQERMSEPNHDVEWHYGFWGQFINARTTLNQRHARFLRETGELPLLPRESWCTFEELREHLGLRT
jgi:hypothetical protein